MQFLFFVQKYCQNIHLWIYYRSPEKKEKKRVECSKFCAHFGHLITLMASLFTMILLVLVYFIMPPPSHTGYLTLKSIFFFKTPNRNILVLRLLNSRTRMTLKSSIVIFQALKTTAPSLTSAASATSLASTASTALFSQKTSWSQWFDHQWHQNDQYWSFFVEWFIKNLNFHWYMAPFLSEAVEASLCYFFENWWMKLKCHNLRNTQIPSNKV